MTREEFLKMLIKQKGYTIKSFAAKIGIPYTSLLSMLNGSIGVAAVESIIKICEELSISVESLKSEYIDDTAHNYYIDPETARLAQEIYDNPDLRILMDASRKLAPSDVKTVADLVTKLKKKENHEDD